MSDSESEGVGAAMEVDGGEAPGSDHGTATGADETLGTAGLGSGVLRFYPPSTGP